MKNAALGANAMRVQKNNKVDNMVDLIENGSMLVMLWVVKLRQPMNVQTLYNSLTGLIGKHSRSSQNKNMFL